MPKIRVQDIASLTDFHRNSTAHCKRLRLSGRPEVLTVNGKAVLVVQDAAAYQRMLEAVERAGEVLPVERQGRSPPGMHAIDDE